MKSMKKLFSFASLSAIAFFGAVSFTACSSSDEVVENNPNYNPETNAVKTEFVINVTQPNERTRMLADNAGAGAFQGINNMKLLCLTGAPAIDNEITTAKSLTLNTYNSSPAIDNTDNTLTNSSSSVYTMYIPVGTTNFLFYATASIPNTNDKFAKGSLVNNLATATTVATATPAASDIKFNLESIQSTAASVTTPQSTLLSVLNGIAAASYDNGTTDDTTDDITWASTTSKTEVQWTALKNAFYQFTNQVGANSGDIRQGSSAAILNMVVDLFGAVNDVYTNEANAEAKGVAKAILDAIKTYFNVTLTGTTYTWESPAYNSDYNVNYPENLNLPTGSAVIVYNNNAFSFVNDGQMGTSAVSVAYNNFTYPSQLTYYCNSGLWQTTTGKNNTTDWPQTSAAWVTEGNWSGWNNGAVTAATRAVAMKDNITYGAAQLVSTIKLAANVGTTTAPLVDNAAAVTNNVEANKSFDGSTADKTITLKVHGLLIGGQPDAAQYEYLPQGTTFNKVIYDKFSTDGQTVNSTGYTNYTLALDNFLASTTATPATQNTVNVALEMTADKDFYGASGKIKSGQKFYLIGSLDPANGGTITWADHTSFKSGDTGQGVDRVFIRDAKTEATFTLGANCLKNAYSTIPDLRSTQMLFGISVDLAWKAGLVFDVNIGQ